MKDFLTANDINWELPQEQPESDCDLAALRAERDAYRDLAHAALDDLHRLTRDVERQNQTIAHLRDELRAGRERSSSSPSAADLDGLLVDDQATAPPSPADAPAPDRVDEHVVGDRDPVLPAGVRP